MLPWIFDLSLALVSPTHFDCKIGATNPINFFVHLHGKTLIIYVTQIQHVIHLMLFNVCECAVFVVLLPALLSYTTKRCAKKRLAS
jgi:hypothetical protein